MKNLVIIGAGAFARELFYHAQGSLGYGKTWRVKGFIDGNVPIGEEEGRLLPMPILGDVFSYARLRRRHSRAATKISRNNER